MIAHLPLHEKRKILVYLGAHDESLFKWTCENVLRPGKDHVVLLACVPRSARRRSSTSSTGSFDGVRRRMSLPMVAPVPTNTSSTNSNMSTLPESVVWEDVDEARDSLERYSRTLLQDNITNEEHVVPGDPRDLLPRFARDHGGMNIVVIAGEPSKKLSLGSTTLGERVAKEVGAQCTIVTVRNPQQLDIGIPAVVAEE